MDIKQLELSSAQLIRQDETIIYSFASTSELPPLQRIIGQPRAVRAIDFGIDMPNHGYNVYVVGAPGSGRTTVVRQFLTRRAATRPVPAEWCYVYNFEDPRRPRALNLPAGRALKFRDLMTELVQQLQAELPKAFEGEFYEQRRREIGLELQRKQQELLQNLESYLRERGFALIRSQAGLTIAPMLNGEVLTGEAYEKLDAETKKRFEGFRPDLTEQFDKTMRQARETDREGKQALDNVTHELSGFVVEHRLADLREGFGDCPKVLAYLQAVRDDVVQNASEFIPKAEGEGEQLAAMVRGSKPRWMDRYKVNVLVEPTQATCAPVVIEDNATYQNLVGRIEHRAEFGTMVTDFTEIRAGDLHRANGGYLVVEAKSLLSNPSAWEGLKRALRNQEIKIEEMAQLYGLVSTVSLEPEPIPLDMKVVVIGDDRLYQLLYQYDEDFRELFKVKSEFAASVRLDQETGRDYALFIGDLCRRENLRHFAPEAVSSVVEQSARLVEDQQRVTTRFADVADLVREACLFAERAGHELVMREDVRTAVAERRYRAEYVAERYRETIQDGVIFVDTQGAVVGQVNGLSVVQIGDFEFGLPSRITAKTFVGKGGVVSIDREVKMSGPIHDKGQLILSSCLHSRFAQKRALGVSATLTFEQNYSGVEGDSASSTELYALLSSLSDIPIKQNLAVTGSVNQLGHVQPIGGVNAKIEGFYDVCVAKGLTGDQGVLIPATNVRHLMLREDVRQAVGDGKFHIYAVRTIEEGVEILTGVPAGQTDADGQYPPDSVYGCVQSKLDEYARYAKEEESSEHEEDKACESPAVNAAGKRSRRRAR